MKQGFELSIDNLSPIGSNVAVGFISANPGEGTSTAAMATARNIALNVAPKVLLVDANFHDAAVHEELNLAESPGLSDVLQKSQNFKGAVRSGKGLPFDVLTSGKTGSLTLQLLKSEAFTQFVKEVRGQYDYVFFDLPAVNAAPAVTSLASVFDGVVLVVECENTRWEVAQNAKTKLEAANATILGVIMNKRRFYIPRFLYGSV